MIPAAGQAILAVQGRSGENYDYLRGYSDEDARLCALAERAFVRSLGGSCSTPIGAYATVCHGKVVLQGLYFDEERQQLYTGTETCSLVEPEKAGRELAYRFLAQF